MEKVISKMTSIESELKTALESSNRVLSNQMRTLYWVIGVTFALITIMIGFLALR